MAAQLNHLIIAARDKQASARFLTEMLQLGPPVEAGRFMAVSLDNGVTLDFAERQTEFPSQHYAFLVNDDVFDSALARIRERGMDHWADPARRRPGEINTTGGGRRVYFLDPSGHYLEILTRPSGGA